MKWVIDQSGNCNASVAGNAYCFGKNHPHYQRLIGCLRKNNVEHFEALYDYGEALERYCEGSVELKNGSLYWDNYKMPDLFVDRVVEMREQGCNFTPMLNFLDNLSDNPSDRSIVELFDFLQHKDLPITPDGCFLAYKAVNNDFTDKYSGTFDNKIGNIVEVARESVDATRDHHCSNGLHVGSIDYVLSYGRGGSKDEKGNVSFDDNGDQFIVCKVNPKDVVSVPTDCRYMKLRTCRYEVVSILKKIYDKPVAGYQNHIQVSRTATPELVKKISRVGRLLASV